MKQEKTDLLSIYDVSHVFEKKNVSAVSHLSLVIQMGEMTALIGPNGCGKSTLMAICAGVLKPSTGKVKYGKEISVSGKVPIQGVGYLPENLEVWDGTTVYEYLTHIGKMNKVSQLKDSILELAKELLIEDVLTKEISELSKGTRHRVLLAGVILKNPQVLILDEPTDGLDPLQRVKILSFLQKLSKSRAVFVSTHQLEDLEPFFDRTLVMKEGKIILDTTPKELARHGKGDISLAYRVMMTNRGKK